MSGRGWLAWTLAWGALTGGAQGQIELVCRAAHTALVQYEPVEISVEIRNNGSSALTVGGATGNAALHFDVRTSAGVGVPVMAGAGEAAPPPVAIQPGSAQKVTLDLLEQYDLRDPGQYAVQTRVDLGSRSYLAQKLFLEVVPGAELKRLMVSPPGQAELILSFSLRSLFRERGEHLFLCVEDEEQGVSLGVVPLGRLLKIYPPILRLDGLSQVHVLHQSAPAQYTHTVVSALGAPLRKNVMASQAMPRLIEKGGGELDVDFPREAVLPPPKDAAAGTPVKAGGKKKKKDKDTEVLR